MNYFEKREGKNKIFAFRVLPQVTTTYLMNVLYKQRNCFFRVLVRHQVIVNVYVHAEVEKQNISY